MIRDINSEPKIVGIAMSEQIYAFLSKLNKCNNGFLTKMAEDILATHKEKILNEIDKKDLDDSKKGHYDNLRKYVSTLQRQKF